MDESVHRLQYAQIREREHVDERNNSWKIKKDEVSAFHQLNFPL